MVETSYLPGPLFFGHHLVPKPSREQTQHETNLSTEPAQARPHPRIPCPQCDPKRAQGPRCPPRKRSDPPNAALNGEHRGALAKSPVAGLPPVRRLREAAAFRRVFADPRRFPGKGFTVLARRGITPVARLGLAISKRSAARAVDRNRLKRIVRESFRLWARELPPVDLVVLCDRDARLLTAERLRHTLDRAWTRVRSQTWGDS